MDASFTRYNLHRHFGRTNPISFTCHPQSRAPAASPSAARCERTAVADPAMGVGQFTYCALQVRFALTPHQLDQLLERCAAKAMYVCDVAF
jgi:hypothetical protein